MRQLEQIKNDLIGRDSSRAEQAKAEIIDQPTNDSISMVCDLLSSQDPSIRARAAFLVRKLRVQQALPFLVKALADPQTRGHRGSLAFALAALDCRSIFSFIFDLALTANNFEVENHCLSILSTQVFQINQADLDRAITRLQVFAKRPMDHRPELSDLVAELERVLSTIQQSFTPMN